MISLGKAIEALLRSILADEDRHGGLLFPNSIRKADELRALLAADRRRRREPEAAEPTPPLHPRGLL
jgi:hypothetical protein